HDDQVVDVARANPFEDRLEQDPLLDVAEAGPPARGPTRGAGTVFCAPPAAKTTALTGFVVPTSEMTKRFAAGAGLCPAGGSTPKKGTSESPAPQPAPETDLSELTIGRRGLTGEPGVPPFSLARLELSLVDRDLLGRSPGR